MENEEVCGNTQKKHIKKHQKHKVEDREVGRKFLLETCEEDVKKHKESERENLRKLEENREKENTRKRKPQVANVANVANVACAQVIGVWC